MKYRLQHTSSWWEVFRRAAWRTAAAIGLFAAGVLLAMAVCRFLGI